MSNLCMSRQDGKIIGSIIDNNSVGLTTGFTDLDSLTTGLYNADLVCIASRPGMGKTSFALNIALHVAKTSSKSVAIFSLEMSNEELRLKLLSSESKIPKGKLKSDCLSSDDYKKLALANATISNLDIKIDDTPAISVAEISAKCRNTENLGLIIIDYLQLIQDTAKRGEENYRNKATDICGMLKSMAKELNVPVVCLSQLSRDIEYRENKRPILSDLCEYGYIEPDFDIIFALYRDNYYNEDSKNSNSTECIILKNNRGETGTVKLQWFPEITKFDNV